VATPAALKTAVTDLAVLANRDLEVMWRQVSTAVEAREALRDILPGLVDAYGAASATIAANWYDDLRDQKGVRGRFTAIPAELGETGTDSLAGWGVDPLFKAKPDWASARVLIAGGLQRRIANAGRKTVAGSSVADPSARGWQRVGDGRTCEFCSMLLGRGAVYTEATADFLSHDHCGCAAVPAFK
jgi:hypothetical protein